MVLLNFMDRFHSIYPIALPSRLSSQSSVSLAHHTNPPTRCFSADHWMRRFVARPLRSRPWNLPSIQLAGHHCQNPTSRIMRRAAVPLTAAFWTWLLVGLMRALATRVRYAKLPCPVTYTGQAELMRYSVLAMLVRCAKLVSIVR